MKPNLLYPLIHWTVQHCPFTCTATSCEGENTVSQWAFKVNSVVAMVGNLDVNWYVPKFKAINGLFHIVHELFTNFIDILCGTFSNDALCYSQFWLYGMNREILTFFDLHFKKGPVFNDHAGLEIMYYVLYFDSKYEFFFSEMFLEVR